MMKINVGLCRKVGASNNGSRGASINLELELDSSLVGDPAKLKERIRPLFGVVRASLVEVFQLTDPHAGLLGDALEQFAVEHRPVEFLPDQSGNLGSARPGLSIDGDGDARPVR